MKNPSSTYTASNTSSQLACLTKNTQTSPNRWLKHAPSRYEKRLQPTVGHSKNLDYRSIVPSGTLIEEYVGARETQKESRAIEKS
jgi:hypothetical protein